MHGRSSTASYASYAVRNVSADKQWQVYNITPYLEYHPGGIDELMRAAGRDSTDLFNDIHAWVTPETMLAKATLGPVETSHSAMAPPGAPATALKSSEPFAAKAPAKLVIRVMQASSWGAFNLVKCTPCSEDGSCVTLRFELPSRACLVRNFGSPSCHLSM